MAKRIINLTDADVKKLEALRDFFNAGVKNYYVFRSIAQSSLLKREADEQSEISAIKEETEA